MQQQLLELRRSSSSRWMRWFDGSTEQLLRLPDLFSAATAGVGLIGLRSSRWIELCNPW
jgi:hypothetical protein